MNRPDPEPDMWAPIFGRRCKNRLRRRTSLAWGHQRWGRCELRPHRPEVHCALEYGMWVLMFGGDPFRVHLEPTDILVRLVAGKMQERGDL